MAATEKNNADLPLLVGNTMINGTVGDGLCTNCNAAAWPSDRGLALASWYMRCNPSNAGSVGSQLLAGGSLATSQLLAGFWTLAGCGADWRWLVGQLRAGSCCDWAWLVGPLLAGFQTLAGSGSAFALQAPQPVPRNGRLLECRDQFRA
jgi:hypothetical protein